MAVAISDKKQVAKSARKSKSSSEHVVPVARLSTDSNLADKDKNVTSNFTVRSPLMFADVSLIKRRSNGADKTAVKSPYNVLPVRHSYSAKHVIAALTSPERDGVKLADDDGDSDSDVGDVTTRMSPRLNIVKHVAAQQRATV